MKGLLEGQIVDHLHGYLNRGNDHFDDVLGRLKSVKDEGLKNLLRYVDAVVEDSLFKGQTNCEILHLHFEDDFEADVKLGIAEFLLVKLFQRYDAAATNNDVDLPEPYKQLLKELEGNYRRKRDYCPEGASTFKGGNRLYKNWQKEVGNSLSILKFYRDVVGNQIPSPRTLFNTGAVLCDSLARIFEFRPYATPLNGRYGSYGILSHGKTMNDIDQIDCNLLNTIDTLVIFDYEWNRMMTHLSFNEINNWNSHFGTSIRNQLIVSFGKGRSSLGDIVKKSLFVRERLKTPVNTMYGITKMETDLLLGKTRGVPIEMRFIGEDSSDFWENLKVHAKIHGLYELRSIRMSNVFSICLNDDIKDYIMEDLFSFDRDSELISYEAKQTMNEMDDADFSKIKSSVSGLLDLIIASGIREQIIDRLDRRLTVVMDDSMVDNQSLMKKFKEALGNERLCKVLPWSEVYGLDMGRILFLSYRDPGRYPNLNYPNLLESELPPGNMMPEALLQKALYKDLRGWATYQLQLHLHRLLDHPIRRSHFGWQELRRTLMELRPERPEFDQGLETEFSRIDQRERYVLKFYEHKPRIVYGSDLYISIYVGSFKVKRIDELQAEVEHGIELNLQDLDEIHPEVNFYGNKLVKNLNRQELSIVLRRHGLEDETSGRLWKILLRRRADTDGEEQLYEALKDHLRTMGLSIVSFDRFKSYWISPLSDTICPSKNLVFKAICDFLSIDSVYYSHTIRERNARYPLGQMTRKWILLYKDMFNDGFFDDGVTIGALIERRLHYYKINHSLDDLGISEEQIKDSLDILVQLIKEEIAPLRVEYLRKSTQ